MARPAARGRPRADAWRSPLAAARCGRLGSPPAAACAPCFRRARLGLRAQFPRTRGVARSPAPGTPLLACAQRSPTPRVAWRARPLPRRGSQCAARFAVRSAAARSMAAHGDPARPTRSTPALPLAVAPCAAAPCLAWLPVARSAVHGQSPQHDVARG
jgi:hypothetical protein